MRQRAPRIKDIAERAGVSSATVSIALSGDESTNRVSAETRRRVLEVADELGYVLNQVGRGLRRGATEHVCVVSRWPDSPWTHSLTTRLAAVADRHRYSSALFTGGDWQGYLGKRTVDGAIIDAVGDGAFDTAPLRPLIDRGLALAVLNDHLEPDGFDVIRTNEKQACDQAMAHLISAGHRRIACLRQWPQDPPRRIAARFTSYVDALQEAGIGVEESLVRDTNGSRELAYAAALELLAAPDRPTAIFAASDLAAISAMWAAHRLGLRVPDDVAIIGVGNAPEGAVTDPALTTVGPDPDDFTTVSELLFERLTADSPLPGRLHPQRWELIHRGSA